MSVLREWSLLGLSDNASMVNIFVSVDSVSNRTVVLFYTYGWHVFDMEIIGDALFRLCHVGLGS